MSDDRTDPAVASVAALVDMFKDMVLGHFNQPMLSSLGVVRCVGYGEDDSDCYVVVRRPAPYADVVWLTAVGGYVFLDRLRGQEELIGSDGERWDDLMRLDLWLELNGAPKAEMPIVEILPDEPRLGPNAPVEVHASSGCVFNDLDVECQEDGCTVCVEPGDIVSNAARKARLPGTYYVADPEEEAWRASREGLRLEARLLREEAGRMIERADLLEAKAFAI